MSIISERSRALLKGQKNAVLEKKVYTVLLSELSLISQLILTKVQTPWTKWKLSWKGQEGDDDNFSCTLTTNYALDEQVQLCLHIDAKGGSYLEAGVNGDTESNAGLWRSIKQFLSTPAGRRYFVLKNENSAIIQAKINQREIVSQNFGDYIAHLIDHMEPFLTFIINDKVNRVSLA